MDILRITYDGRVTAARQKKLSEQPPAIARAPHAEYMCLVMKVYGVQEARWLAWYLGLSSLPNLQKSPKAARRNGRGWKGISRYGTRVVRSAATLLEDRAGRRLLSFLTLTIPSECLTRSLIETWSESARKLRQWLVYSLEAKGLASAIVGVVEIQEKRQNAGSALPCLHWHLLFQGRKAGDTWAISKEDVQAYWNKLLEEHSGVKPRTQASTRIESVRKSAAGYLGKYMSKGVRAIKDLNVLLLPSSWYMCTRKLLRWVKKAEFYATGSVAEVLFDHLIASPEMLRFAKFVEIPMEDGTPLKVGWYGDLLDRTTYHEFVKLCREINSKG